MDLSSRTSEESFRNHDLQDSKEGLLKRFPNADETPKCSACESRRNFRLNVVVPGLIFLTLFILLLGLGLGLASSKSKKCFPFWSETEICKFRFCY